MSELRQRRGGGVGSELASSKEDAPGLSKQELLEELTQMLGKMKRTPKPGTSNEAKKMKDALLQDPYNMDLIYELGRAYANDDQWDRCLNVLLRGWKRVSEFEDPVVRFEFLASLCQASLQCNKYRQALAVLNDIQEPAQCELSKSYEVLKCQVYCSAGELQKGLKAFNAAIESETFEDACSIWAGCTTYLKKVGAHDVAKHTLEGRASNDDERAKLKALESLAELRDTVLAQPGEQSRKLQMWLVGTLVLLALLALGYILYILEARSLERLKIRK